MAKGKTTLKYALLVGVVGVTGTTIIWIRKQYQKLLKNVTTFKSFKVGKITLNEFDFEVVYDYTNNMDVDIVLASQKYDIFLDGNYITTLTNDKTTTLKANATTPIPLTLKLNPKELSQRLSSTFLMALMQPLKANMRIDMSFKVKLFIFKIPVPYSYSFPVTIPALLPMK
jgi:LEA14-like dessication related protein